MVEIRTMTHESEYMSEDQVQKVFEVAQIELERMLILFLFKTGSRIDEVIPYRHPVIKGYETVDNKRKPIYEYEEGKLHPDGSKVIKQITDKNSGLRKRHVNFEEGIIHLRNLKRKKGKRAFKSVYIDPEFTLQLKQYCERLGNEDLLFPIDRFKANRIFRRLCKKAGVTVGKKNIPHVHILRHSFAMQGVKKHLPLHFLKSQLGHSSLEATGFYLHVNDKENKELVKKMWK